MSPEIVANMRYIAEQYQLLCGLCSIIPMGLFMGFVLYTAHVSNNTGSAVDGAKLKQ